MRGDQREVPGALRRLPRRQRDCLILHDVMELTVPAIADTLGLSVNSVKTRKTAGDARGAGEPSQPPSVGRQRSRCC